MLTNVDERSMRVCVFRLFGLLFVFLSIGSATGRALFGTYISSTAGNADSNKIIYCLSIRKQNDDELWTLLVVSFTPSCCSIVVSY